MSKIKERPILFSAPMVRAILEGRKTVTRREVKKKAALDCLEAGFEPAFLTLPGNADLCPYGQPGDRLWVRETWARIQVAQAPDQEWVVYRESDNRTDYGGPWKPGIHMFRRDSRILLEITEVRVERLQDISEEQAKAEGVRLYTDHAELGDWWHVEGIETYSADPRKSFELLWSSVGGDWQANPWVWVVEFKRVTP
ncbi:hypothetical protein [Pseudomonas sp. 2995-1]|uniref:hypothetical protein n=1 Tax=Pseudomonas sp. 2995-1 TaxID=1712679 RepID=UPI000C15C4C7|nr:hypothetical protein [Pseudomonas sp. 2995-1]PIB57204.1 hypothetical protein AOA61_07515 [Pseudomonas sp. 2995-1]